MVCRLWKLFNADAKNEAVRVGAPATNDYWGSVGGAPVEGGSPFTRVEGAVKALEDKIAKIEAELKGTKAPKVGKAVKNTKKGTVRLGVTVPSPGQPVVSGPDIVKVSGHATAPGEVQVLIKAKGKALKTLKDEGKVSVKVTITFTASGKKASTTETVVVVKK